MKQRRNTVDIIYTNNVSIGHEHKHRNKLHNLSQSTDFPLHGSVCTKFQYKQKTIDTISEEKHKDEREKKNACPFCGKKYIIWNAVAEKDSIKIKMHKKEGNNMAAFLNIRELNFYSHVYICLSQTSPNQEDQCRM